MSGGGSLGLGSRSASYGSLQHQQVVVRENGLGIRKSSKLFKEKEKESLVYWICKFVGRKKVGMLLLSIVSAAVFIWVLYMGKGEVTSDTDSLHTGLGFNNDRPNDGINPRRFKETNNNSVVNSKTSLESVNVAERSIALPPPPPAFFLGYTLPPGHRCNSFTLPPPPADKKRTGPRPCPVCYLPVEEAIALMPKVPTYTPVLRNLTYIHEEDLTKDENSFGGSDFGGYPSLKQRSDSFDIRESMDIHCGFVRGHRPGHNTGFDIDESDLLEMDQCQGVVVASAIFGNFDVIQQPKNISEHSNQNVCFFMFVDEVTEAYLKNSSHLESNKKVGLWRIVVIHNPPYTDARRTGKIPKLLLHRLFPNARFSIWLDGKLELVVDPYQILERFLWRKNATFAISRHYRRFDVFVEAEANKAARKYDNASIDFQMDFYKGEGLTPYSADKFPITSDVPEGCVIIKEHVPISNLFTCLWFNEVDRFTSRDQISYAIVRDKIMSRVDWIPNMFFDCERRNFVVQKYHKDLLDHMAPPPPVRSRPPPPVRSRPPPPVRARPPPAASLGTQHERASSNTTKRSPKRGRNRRSNSHRHRKVVPGNDIDSNRNLIT